MPLYPPGHLLSLKTGGGDFYSLTSNTVSPAQRGEQTQNPETRVLILAAVMWPRQATHPLWSVGLASGNSRL